MMFCLVPSIHDRVIDTGNADAKCAVPFLPFKQTQSWKLFWEELVAMLRRHGFDCDERMLD